ncbi:MAG: OmpA family protein [Xanthomonadales bacterium]|nr:OmpA family protein [Xanthomonadales bacterium]
MTDSRNPGDRSEAAELARLRALLLGDEKKRLDRLYQRVTEPEPRTGDVAEVLPGAMNRVADDPVAGPQMERPIVQTIRSAIKRDTESFAEALFPVLGPAIRRAVADALRSLVQRINVAMEHSFTAKGLRWRLEAARSGVPFGQVVMRHTMLYAVQEVFLIQAESGLVLASARREDTLLLDKDAFSAMLTAIQAFIQDSFGAAGGEPLRSAELGDRTLWLINGPRAVLACVIIGSPPHEVREQLMDALETLHSQYGDQFSGAPELVAAEPGVNAILQETLLGETVEPAQDSRRSRSRLIWAGAGLALLLVLTWTAWTAWTDNRLEHRLARLFESEPGYVLTRHDMRDGQFHLAGLRDPLARPPAVLIGETGVDSERVSLGFHPYQSLEAEMIERRLRAALGDATNLELEFDGAGLAVRGALTSAQFAMLENLPGLHPVIRSVDLSQARLSAAEAVEQARAQLSAPPSVAFAASAAGDRIEVAGAAPVGWFAAASERSLPVGGWALDFEPLRQSLGSRLSELERGLEDSVVQFSRGLRMTPDSQTRMESLARDLAELQDLAAGLGVEIEIQLEGYADGVGAAEKNLEIAMSRARAVHSALKDRGINPDLLVLAPGHWEGGAADPQQRKVVVQITREPAR